MEKNMKDFERSKIDWLITLLPLIILWGCVFYFFSCQSSLIKLSVRFVLF